MKAKKHHRGRYVVIAIIAIALGFFVILPFYLGPDDLAGCGEKPDTKNLLKKCQPADAIVALSGGDTTARTAEAIKLYKNDWADTLIFSGAAHDKTGPSNAEIMRRQAMSQGVPSRAILVEETALDTEENAARTQPLIVSNNFHRIIVVTSAYHQRRASLEFQKNLSSGVEVMSHPVVYDKQWSKNWFLTPSGWWLALGELVKIIGFYASP